MTNLKPKGKFDSKFSRLGSSVGESDGFIKRPIPSSSLSINDLQQLTFPPKLMRFNHFIASVGDRLHNGFLIGLAGFIGALTLTALMID